MDEKATGCSLSGESSQARKEGKEQELHNLSQDLGNKVYGGISICAGEQGMCLHPGWVSVCVEEGEPDHRFPLQSPRLAINWEESLG